MKITVLIENTTRDNSLVNEHGISLYIETSRDVILFDSGQSGNIILNARKLGVDLGRVNFAVLSHGHYDHSGGFMRFLEANDHAKLYMNKDVFGNHLNRKGKYIGVDPKLRVSQCVVFTGNEYRIKDGLTLYTCNDRELKYPIDSAGLSIKTDGVTRPDVFRHEHYLLIEDEGKRVVISGCSHKGILNIVNWFEPDYLIGGFHFMDINVDTAVGRKRLEDAAEELLGYDTKYYTGHCTGMEQYEYMKNIMGNRLEYIYTGKSFEI